jgi:hypothetical protein
MRPEEEMPNITTMLKKGWFDEKRLPLIVESKDWTVIEPAIIEWGAWMAGVIVPPHDAVIPSMYKILRLLFEIAYQMGYARGLQRAQTTEMVWMVAPEQEQED